MNNYSNEVYYDEGGLDYDSVYSNVIYGGGSFEQESFNDQQAAINEAKGYLSQNSWTVVGVLLGVLVIILFILLFCIINKWKIYKKANKPGWASIIPFYDWIVMLEVCGLSYWLILLAIFLYPIYFILVGINLAKKFNKSTGFAIGLIFLPMFFYPILAFSKSQYVGASESHDANLSSNNNVNNINNSEGLSNDLGFAPQVNNTEVNMQPNLGINSNSLNQNVNSDLANNIVEGISMSNVLESKLEQDNNAIVEENIVNSGVDSIIKNTDSPVKLDESLNTNNTQLNNDVNTLANDSISNNNVNISSFNVPFENSNNTNIGSVEEKKDDIVSNVNISSFNVPFENSNNTNIGSIKEEPLSFNSLTENQEMLEKTSVLPNLSKINIHEMKSNVDNNEVINSGVSNSSSNISFGDLTNIVCPNCGTKCIQGDMFCINCGSKLN